MRCSNVGRATRRKFQSNQVPIESDGGPSDGSDAQSDDVVDSYEDISVGMSHGQGVILGKTAAKEQHNSTF